MEDLTPRVAMGVAYAFTTLAGISFAIFSVGSEIRTETTLAWLVIWHVFLILGGLVGVISSLWGGRSRTGRTKVIAYHGEVAAISLIGSSFVVYALVLIVGSEVDKKLATGACFLLVAFLFALVMRAVSLWRSIDINMRFGIRGRG